MSTETERVDVVVIGAGAAGLSAARELQRRGKRAVLLEAADKCGGRVLADRSLAEWPLELGPEFVHGEHHNRLIELIEEAGGALPLTELEWPNYYYFGKEGRLVEASVADAEPDFSLMHESFEALGELAEDAAPPEQSLLQYFAAQGLSSRALDLADAIYANDFGGDMSDIGLHETIHEQRHWKYGEKYLVLGRGCLQDAMELLAKGLDVRTGWAVAKLSMIGAEQSVLCDAAAGVVEGAAAGAVAGAAGAQAAGAQAAQVLVESADGRKLLAQRAVVAVPLAVLQRGTIGFSPPLPPQKVAAIDSIRVGNALKVIVRLQARFWPDDFFDAVCADCFFPEVWLSPAAELMTRSEPPFTIVGFVAGERSKRVAKLGEAEVARLLLLQLDAMFGDAERPRPASEACDGFVVHDWATQPHAYGAYSHPTLGAAGERPKLAAPLRGASEGEAAARPPSIFFAGEACHEGVNPCIHGAMETGEIAAELVWQSFDSESSQSG